MIQSVIAASAIPLFMLYVIWTLEIYAIHRKQWLIFSALWGVCAFFIAYIIQSSLSTNQLLSATEIRLISAPILEEILKASVFLLLFYRLAVRYAVEGAFYGFAVGTAFAIAENLAYAWVMPEGSFEVALARSLSVSVMHAFTTSLIGAILGSTYLLPRRKRVMSALVALAIAMIAHAVFNRLALQLSGTSLIIAGIAYGFISFTAIFVIIRHSLQREKNALNTELSDMLSAGERAAAIHPDQFEDLLYQNREVLGPRRTRLLREYIQLQSLRGILQKTMHLNKQDHYHEILRKELRNVDEKLATLRGSIGLYAWVWLRSVMPSEESPLWQQLGTVLNTQNPTLDLLIKLSSQQGMLSPSEIRRRKALLRSTNVFYSLDNPELEDLALLLTMQTYEVGDVILKNGQIDHHLYVVAEGNLVVSVQNEHEDETILSSYTVTDVFGELSLIDLKPHPANVSALSHVKLLSLSREDLFTLIYAKPQISIELMRGLVNQIRQNTALIMWIQNTSNVAPLPPPSKENNFIKSLGAQYENQTPPFD